MDGSSGNKQRFQRTEFNSPAINKFFLNISALSEGTIGTYKAYLKGLPSFCQSAYGKSLDQMLLEIKAGNEDPYDFLNGYMGYLHKLKKSTNFMTNCVKTGRIFLESHRIEMSDRTFRQRVRFPRKVNHDMYALSKGEVRELVLACSNIWLKTFLLLLASTGMRPIEACSLKHKDIDLKSIPAKAYIKAEFTKMRKDRYVYLTTEAAKAIAELIEYNHRKRDVVYHMPQYRRITIVPVLRPNDLLFSPYRRQETHRVTKVRSIYKHMQDLFNTVRAETHKAEKVDYWNRGQITFYSLRRWIKSSMSDLGYSDFSEWYIGHKGSTYYRRKESERIDVFKRLEPHLLILDYASLDVRQADNESKILSLNESNVDMKRTIDKLMHDRDGLAKELFDKLKREFMAELDNRLG